LIYAGTKGYLDEIPVEQMKEWKEKFLKYFKDKGSDIRDVIRKNEKVEGKIEEKLVKLITEFSIV
jgi:F-type H+-transporting ATPase subunit alpha